MESLGKMRSEALRKYKGVAVSNQVGGFVSDELADKWIKAQSNNEIKGSNNKKSDPTMDISKELNVDPDIVKEAMAEMEAGG
jgi:hypothetical protein